jgi:hypothetical protein
MDAVNKKRLIASTEANTCLQLTVFHGVNATFLLQCLRLFSLAEAGCVWRENNIRHPMTISQVENSPNFLRPVVQQAMQAAHFTVFSLILLRKPVIVNTYKGGYVTMHSG